LQSQTGRSTVHVYYFDVHTPDSPDGAYHGAELPYVFGNFDSTPRPVDIALSDLMRNYWINFAATGDPNGVGLPSWPAYTDVTPQALVFDAHSSARTLPNVERIRAIDSWFSCAQGKHSATGQR
jgi:para-nitrobenzyl esterase